jgi:hypothetical protein
MSDENRDLSIDYIELMVTDIAEAKRFYGEAFGWTFQDYGPGYSSFNDGRREGGFQVVDGVKLGGPLVVLYADDLEAAKTKVEQAGGDIAKDIFSFPGGRRFEFTDPDGTLLAVWSAE